MSEERVKEYVVKVTPLELLMLHALRKESNKETLTIATEAMEELAEEGYVNSKLVLNTFFVDCAYKEQFLESMGLTEEKAIEMMKKQTSLIINRTVTLLGERSNKGFTERDVSAVTHCKIAGFPYYNGGTNNSVTKEQQFRWLLHRYKSVAGELEDLKSALKRKKKK